MPALTDEWFKKSYAELLAEATRTGALVGPSSRATRWSPDTCKCCLDQIADGHEIVVVDDRGEERPVFVGTPTADVRHGGTVRACAYHVQHADPKVHYEAVLAENQRKNRFEREIHLAHPRGDDRPVYRWSFDDARNLVVEVAGLAPRHAASLRAIAQLPEFAGKVTTRG